MNTTKSTAFAALTCGVRWGGIELSFNICPVTFDPDKPTAILGGGPSAAGIDLERLQSHTNLISINDSIKYTPNAMCFFTIDGTYFSRKNPMGDFTGPKYICLPYNIFRKLKLYEYPNTIRLDRMRSTIMSEDKLVINVCEGLTASSGHGAINLAYLFGEKKKILLFGFDGGPIPEDEPTHWNRESNHSRWGSKRCMDMDVGYGVIYKQLLKKGIEVFSASPGTQIEVFPVITHDEALS